MQNQKIVTCLIAIFALLQWPVTKPEIGMRYACIENPKATSDVWKKSEYFYYHSEFKLIVPSKRLGYQIIYENLVACYL